MSPKDKVRGNIYKELFSEEKKKNKRMTVASLSLFVVGLFSGSMYQSVKEVGVAPRALTAFNIPKKEGKGFVSLAGMTSKPEEKFSIGKFKDITEQNITIEHILNDDMFSDSKREVKTVQTERLFGLDDTQI
ncbi:hypothetical protein [Fusobacterium sp. PH5-44]|uniref:hypothetical protein n=1 Tax=unclassified Fusobacterium TaxID=2648384 RepID=UPI003D1CD621